MSTAQITIELEDDLVAKAQIESISDLIDAFKLANWGNFARGNFASTSTPITVSATAPGSPKVGEHWLDTSASPYVLKHWTGSQWTATSFSASATAPTSPAQGDLWYDTTLKLLRLYQSLDAVLAWHPLDSNYLVLHADSGTNPVQGNVIVRGVGSGFRSCLQSTAVDRLATVRGVALEDFDATTRTGVVAGVHSNAVVQILCDETTHAVLSGEVIGTAASTVGHGRSYGQLTTNAYQSSVKRRSGVQFGGFAQAMENGLGSGKNLVTCRMLGGIGQGLRVMEGPDVIAVIGDTGGGEDDFTTTEWSGATQKLDLNDLPGSRVDPAEAKHYPLVAVKLRLAFKTTNSGVGHDLDMLFSAGGGLMLVDEQARQGGAGSAPFKGVWEGWVPTNDTGGTKLGSVISWAGIYATSGGTLTVDSETQLSVVEYLA